MGKAVETVVKSVKEIAIGGGVAPFKTESNSLSSINRNSKNHNCNSSSRSKRLGWSTLIGSIGVYRRTTRIGTIRDGASEMKGRDISILNIGQLSCHPCA